MTHVLWLKKQVLEFHLKAVECHSKAAGLLISDHLRRAAKQGCPEDSVRDAPGHPAPSRADLTAQAAVRTLPEADPDLSAHSRCVTG